jgi:hypothetical protein
MWFMNASERQPPRTLALLLAIDAAAAELAAEIARAVWGLDEPAGEESGGAAPHNHRLSQLTPLPHSPAQWFRVSHAGEALRHVTLRRPNVVLVCADYKSAEEPARLAGALRQRRPALPVLFVIDEPDERAELAARASGASGFFAWGDSSDQRMLRRALEELGIPETDKQPDHSRNGKTRHAHATHSGLSPPERSPPGQMRPVTSARSRHPPGFR